MDRFLEKFNFSNLRLFWKAFSRYRFHIIWLGFLSVISGLLEGIGINAVIPLFAFVNSDASAETDAVSEYFQKIFMFFNIGFTIKAVFFFILAMFLIKAVLLFYSNELTNKITTRYQRDSQLELFKLMAETDWPHLAQQKIGYLDQLLTTYLNYASGLLTNASFFLLSAANLLIYGLVIINISSIVAFSVLIVGILLFFLFKPLFYKNNKISGEAADIYKELAHYVNERILGMKIIKSLFVEREVIRDSAKHFDRMEELNRKIFFIRNLSNSLLQPAGIVFILGIFAFFYKTGAFAFGSFAVVVYAIQRLFSQIQVVQSQIHSFGFGLPYLADIVRYKEEALKYREENNGTNKFSFNNSLDFKQVGFFYDNNVEVLSGIDFSVKKGEILGLIGPSGAGKTTLVDLLLRLYQPRKGTIVLDSENIADIDMKEWRSNIGYVPQEAFLVNDTIENNIKFYNDSVTDEDMEKSAKIANIHEFIERQPDKFQSRVGERGTLLSGGQRQRIALARVLARNPQILILDEATSSLDNESEFFIQKSIENLRGKITIIIIAHRLSTVMIADHLIALEGGKILEEGTPAELLGKENSYFAKNYNLK